MKSYYEILGISESADAVAIKKAYRGLVKKYHPDIYKGDDRDTKFQEIQKAYDVLSDESKRAAYDRTGRQNYEQSEKYGNRGGFNGFSGYQDFNGFGTDGGFSGFEGFNTFKFTDIPLYKRILIVAGIALMAIIWIIGFILVSIVRVIISIINEIFR